MNHDDKITYFAETDARNKRVPFGIKASDRTRHVYIIGKTGMGKSTMLENMAIQDIRNGEGFAFIDPHGKTAELLLDYIPQERIKDVLYFAPFDLEHPISFNVMEDVGHERRHLVANGLMSAFKKIWVDAWSARMEYILNNILLSLLEYPGSTLIGVNRMLVDKDYRLKVVDNITDPSVKAFWTDEFAKYGERYMQEAGAAIQNKIGQFISNPLVRNIIGQPKSTFDIRKIMDEKKILIINLSKGRVGEANANLLGSMLITKIYLAAMSRADTSPSTLKNLPNFYLYVDEFQSFANESFADILSEARKYKLNLTIAHQYIEQMSDEVRAAVFGNVGTMVVFRVGAIDAEVLEKEFYPTFTKEDLVNLGFVQIYLKLMIDGVTSAPFSAVTLPPFEKPMLSFKGDIINFTRDVYAHPRVSVEEDIKKWHEPVEPRDSRKIGGNSQNQGKPKRLIQAPKKNQEEDLRKAIAESYLKHTQNLNPEKQERQEEFEKKPETKPEIQTEERKPEPVKVDIQQKNPAPQKQEEVKSKKDKGPKPENLNALRQALSSVIKETVPTREKPQPVNVSVQVNVPTLNHTEIRNDIREEIKLREAERNKTSRTYRTVKTEERPHENAREEAKQEKAENQTSEEKETPKRKRKQPTGVPEEVLKQVLEME